MLLRSCCFMIAVVSFAMLVCATIATITATRRALPICLFIRASSNQERETKGYHWKPAQKLRHLKAPRLESLLPQKRFLGKGLSRLRALARRLGRAQSFRTTA